MSNKPEKAKSPSQNLPEELPKEVATVIKDLPKDKQKIILRALTISHHNGPLPDSDTITVYNQVIPNGGDRLMKTVEKQLDHRVEIEKVGVRRSYNQSSTGQWMAFVLAVIFGLIAWDLARQGKETAATIIGTVDLVGLVTVFITGRVTKK